MQGFYRDNFVISVIVIETIESSEATLSGTHSPIEWEGYIRHTPDLTVDMSRSALISCYVLLLYKEVMSGKPEKAGRRVCFTSLCILLWRLNTFK